MRPATSAAHVDRFLQMLQGVRSTHDGWDACCPCPDHNQDGDQNASLHISTGHDGRILVKCRVGCPTDAVLDALGLDWHDLFAPSPDAVTAPPEQSTAFVRETPGAQAAADPDLRNQAYQTLLAQLTLAGEHVGDLERRGLNDDERTKRGYRSLRNIDRGRAARAVHQQLGDAVLSVPGFTTGPHGITLAGTATGLLVPVRDLDGRLVALKIRQAGKPKYLYLSSKGDGDSHGPSPGSPIHIPLGVTAPAKVVRLTEGELKSDVCVALDGIPTIGVPGVALWKPALPILKSIGAETVVLAFDADLQHKVPVFEQVEMIHAELVHNNFNVEVEVWE